MIRMQAGLLPCLLICCLFQSSVGPPPPLKEDDVRNQELALKRRLSPKPIGSFTVGINSQEKSRGLTKENGREAIIPLPYIISQSGGDVIQTSNAGSLQLNSPKNLKSFNSGNTELYIIHVNEDSPAGNSKSVGRKELPKTRKDRNRHHRQTSTLISTNFGHNPNNFLSGIPFSSSDDIHTDKGMISPFGIPLLSTDGMVSHSLKTPFPGGNNLGHVSVGNHQTSSILISNDDNENVVIHQNGGDGKGRINDLDINHFTTNDNSGIPLSEAAGGFVSSDRSSLQQTQPKDNQHGLGFSVNSDQKSHGSNQDPFSFLNILQNENNALDNLLSDSLGSLTIGELLAGLNGQNGIVVMPMSEAKKQADNIDFSFLNGGKSLDDTSEGEGGSPTTTSAPETTTRRRRRPGGATTKAPDTIRVSLSDLLYAKGQWLGTLIGGLIDFGRIAMDSFKAHSANQTTTSYGAPPPPSYEAPTTKQSSYVPPPSSTYAAPADPTSITSVYSEENGQFGLITQ